MTRVQELFSDAKKRHCAGHASIFFTSDIPIDDLKKRLTQEQFRVTQEAGTERAFSGEYWNHFADGEYACVCCGEVLFSSSAKFDAHCGWPSFSEPADQIASAMALGKLASQENSKIEDRLDTSHGVTRVEVVCRNCKAHLGHVFEDGPAPTGLRYCINSASLVFLPGSSKR